MEIFDSINLQLLSNPDMLLQLEYLFRIKFWLLLSLAFYFILLPYRQHYKDVKNQAKQSKKRDRFLA